MRENPWSATDLTTPDTLPREVLELGEVIARLPEESIELDQAYSRVVECMQRRKRVLSLVQEALSQLRLDIKYLMFDLDMTRKEKDELKSQLADLLRDDGASDN